VAVAVGNTGRLEYAVNSAGFDGGNTQYDTISYPDEIFAKQNIRVNVICPALVNTPLIAKMAEENPTHRAALDAAHPIGRIAEPSEIADAVVRLCSDISSFVADGGTGGSTPRTHARSLRGTD